MAARLRVELMRVWSLAAVTVAALVAGCISYNAGPSITPTIAPEVTLAQITQAPTVAPQPTPVVTLAPGASPSPDIRALLNAQITVFNVSDSDLSISAVIHDPSTDGEDVPIADFTLGPNQVTTRSVIGGNEQSGGVPYLLQFTYPGGSIAGGSCTLSVMDGQDFTFVAVNDGLTVMRGEETPATAAELAIATSSLCIAPAPTATP